MSQEELLECLDLLKKVILLHLNLEKQKRFLKLLKVLRKTSLFEFDKAKKLDLQVCLNLEKPKKLLKWYKMLRELKLVCTFFYIISIIFCIVICKGAKTLSLLALIGPESPRVKKLFPPSISSHIRG
nr:uncharacterized protein LOC104647000 [Solanum lycopersicum]